MEQMEVNISPMYKFSLDVLDFKYITSNHQSNRNTVKPLWDVTKNEEYYEFELIAEKNDPLQSQNDEILDISSTETCFCHICNVSVPIIYINQHNTSSKHKICIEFADKAMERTRRHIMNHINVSNNTKPPSYAYFCASCSLAVHVNDKAKHEKTKMHVLSVKHDELLDNLLKIYDCNDMAKTDTENSPKKGNNVIKETENVKENATAVVKSNEVDMKKEKQNAKEVEVVHVKKDIDTKINENTVQKSPEIHYHFRKTENIDQIMCKVCKNSIPLTDEAVVMHINGLKHTKNYIKIINRLKRIGDKYYCESCQVFIKENCEIEHVTEHIALEENKKSMLTQNMTKSPELNNSSNNYIHIEEADGVLKCRVCRVVISNNPNCVNTHMNSQTHKTMFNSLITNNKLTKRNDVYFCELCKVLLTKNAEIAHVNNEIHKRLITAQPTSINTVNHIKIATNGKNQSAGLHAHSENYIDMLNKISVSKKDFSISLINNDFVEIVTGQFKVRVPLKHFHGYYESDGKTYCRVCREHVDGVEIHKLSSVHMKRIMTPFTNLNCVRKIDTWSHCILCNEIIENAFTHAFISEKHKVKLQEVLAVHQSNKKVGNRTEIITVQHVPTLTKTYCVVCNVYIDLHNYVSHVNGKTHNSKYNINFPILSKPIDPEFEDIQNVHYHIDKTNDTYVKHCKTCKLIFPSSNLDEHLIGFIHRSNYHSMLTDNQIKTVTNGYYCDVCEVYISKFTLADHAYSQIHAIKLKSKVPPVKPHNHIAVTGNKVTCRVCKTMIPNIPQTITNHINDLVHKKTYDSLLSANKLKKLDKKYACECYVCELCDTHLMENEELDHILDNQDHKNKLGSNAIHHHMKITDNPKILHCKVCKVNVPFITANVNEHIKGYFHIAFHNSMTSGLRIIKDRYYCECCRVFIDNNEEIDHVLIHLPPEEHDNILQSFNSVQHPEVKSVNTVHPHMELKGGVLNCRVCKVTVPNNPNCVETHANGQNHKSKFNELIKLNKTIKRDDRYYCEDCRVYNTNNAVISHLHSDKHKNNMSPQPSSSTSNSVTEKDLAKNIYTCLICHVNVPNNEKNIEEHNKGSFHNSNLKKIKDNLRDMCNVN